MTRLGHRLLESDLYGMQSKTVFDEMIFLRVRTKRGFRLSKNPTARIRRVLKPEM